MVFRHPAFFLLLLLLPLVFFVAKHREKLQFAFSSFELLKDRPATLRMFLFELLPFLRAVIFVLLIAALARPCSTSSDKEYQTTGVDIMIALDISGSMLAEDFQPENLSLIHI